MWSRYRWTTHPFGGYSALKWWLNVFLDNQNKSTDSHIKKLKSDEERTYCLSISCPQSQCNFVSASSLCEVSQCVLWIRISILYSSLCCARWPLWESLQRTQRVDLNFISATCAVLLVRSKVLQWETTCASAAPIPPAVWFIRELQDFQFSIKSRIRLEKVQGKRCNLVWKKS